MNIRPEYVIDTKNLLHELTLNSSIQKLDTNINLKSESSNFDLNMPKLLKSESKASLSRKKLDPLNIESHRTLQNIDSVRTLGSVEFNKNSLLKKES